MVLAAAQSRIQLTSYWLNATPSKAETPTALVEPHFVSDESRDARAFEPGRTAADDRHELWRRAYPTLSIILGFMT